MNWLIYLAEANAYLAAFYLVYCLLLANNTHYQLSRAYLLVGSVVAFILPLVQLNFLKPTLYYTLSDETYVSTPAVSTPLWQTLLFCGYLAGVFIVLTLFIWKLVQLRRLIRSNVRIDQADHKLIEVKGSDTAFSFFSYLFLGSNIKDNHLVVSHELVHIHQKHSADIVFTELLKAVNWFNPVIYTLQNTIRALHEYIADEQTTKCTNDIVAYASFLVGNAYGQTGPAITHSFFNHNLLKKRIIMLKQKRSGNLARLKYLVAVPLCAALLAESSLGFSKSYGIIGIGRQKIEVDTVKAGKIKINPRAPKPDVSKVKFPPTHRDTKMGKISVDPRAPKPDISKVKFPPPAPPKPRVKDVKFPPPAPPKPRVKDVKFPPPPPPVPPAKKTASTTSLPVNEATNKIKGALKNLESNLQHNKAQGSVSTKEKPLPTVGVITAKIDGADKQFVIHGQITAKPVQRTDDGIRIEEPVTKPGASAKPTANQIMIADPVVKPTKTNGSEIRVVE